MSNRESYKSMTDALTKALKRAIASGDTFKGIERETGVSRQSLMLFAAGQQSLRLEAADKVATYFGLTVQAARPARPAPQRKKGGS